MHASSVACNTLPSFTPSNGVNNGLTLERFPTAFTEKSHSLQTFSVNALPPRIPPYSNEAEQALIAALLHNNGSHEKVGEFLLPEHFANGIHQKIYQAIANLIERGQVADPIQIPPP